MGGVWLSGGKVMSCVRSHSCVWNGRVRLCVKSPPGKVRHLPYFHTQLWEYRDLTHNITWRNSDMHLPYFIQNYMDLHETSHMTSPFLQRSIFTQQRNEWEGEVGWLINCNFAETSHTTERDYTWQQLVFLLSQQVPIDYSCLFRGAVDFPDPETYMRPNQVCFKVLENRYLERARAYSSGNAFMYKTLS